jgi:translocating chain-associated membrane protein 1
MGQESQIRRLGGRKSKTSPPILSQEFIIQNHGDILSCVVVLVLAGFMSHATGPIANLFVMPQYNTSALHQQDGTPTLFTNGRADVATISYYVVCAIVVHAVIQEYIMDKLQRKLHLSKTKTSKFTESGHLAVFAIYSVVHAAYIVNQSNFLADPTQLWVGYPHQEMTLLTKLFFLIQISYWLHEFPEFYFAKVKRDEIRSRSVYICLYLIYIVGAYVLNFNRVAVTMLALHFTSEGVYHLTRMAHFAEKPFIAQPAFKVYNILFVAVRLFTIALAFVVFWYGLRSSEVATIDIVGGNFNTPLIRVGSLGAVCFVQVYLMWNFIMFHLRQMRERRLQAAAAANGSKARHNLRQKKSDKTKAERRLEKELSQLPEADQDHNRVLRSASKK